MLKRKSENLLTSDSSPSTSIESAGGKASKPKRHAGPRANRLLRLSQPVSASFEEIVDWKHPLVKAFAKTLPREEALLKAWRTEQGYRWFFQREDLDDLLKGVERKTIDEGVQLGENFLRVRPELPTTGERMRKLPIAAKSRLTKQKNGVAIDWNDKPSKDNIEWIHMVNRMPYLKAMALAARRRKRDDIAERIFELMDHWISHCPVIEEPILRQQKTTLLNTPWHELDTALRLQAWLEALHILWDHPSLTPARFANYVRSMRHHALVVGRIAARRGGSAKGNHLIMEMQGLIYYSMLPWLKDTKNTREVGYHNWRRCVYNQVFDDGGHCQRTPNYHLGSMLWLSMPLRLWQVNDWPIDPEALRRVRAMLNMSVHLMQPDNVVANFGNSNSTGDDFQSSIPLVAEMVGVALPNASTPKGIQGLYARASKSKLKVKKWKPGLWFPQAGFVFTRNAWKSNAHAVAMHVNGFAGGHGHTDWLSFFYSYGGRRIITERGVNSYDITPENLAFRQARAHNVLQIGDREAIVHQNGSIWDKYVNAWAKMLECKIRPDGSADWTAEIKYLDGARWQRRVQFFARTGKMVLEDHYKHFRSDNTELRFHLNTPNAKLVSDYECVTTDRGKPNIRITVEPPVRTLGPWSAELTPEVIAPSFQLRDKGLLLCFKCRAKVPARWITTVEGVKG